MFIIHNNVGIILKRSGLYWYISDVAMVKVKQEVKDTGEIPFIEYLPVSDKARFVQDTSKKVIIVFNTGPGSSVGRVSALGNGRSRVRSQTATYHS